MSVTAAAGFEAAGVSAGLKSSGAPDVALVVNLGPSQTAAGVFTSNRIKAAPVLWTEQCLRTGSSHAVVLNSGGANACTGPEGFADTHHTAEYVAELLECGPIDVAVCSTGLIGVRLDMGLLRAGIAAAADSLADDAAAGLAAARAIMTTDSVPKRAQAACGPAVVGGMAKGAGMLAPGMATMLSVLTTDVIASPELLADVLTAAVSRTFNRVDSDGCMSTNDTVLLLASGASGHTPTPEELLAAVEQVCAELSRQLVADAEGASKEIAVTVRGAATEADAEVAARAVTRSNLFKCAMYGEDPNWGRIISAVGTTDADFEADRIDAAVNDVWVCRAGGVGEDRELVDMSGREVHVIVDLHAGEHEVTVWTNDLTKEYVHENSAYST
ncbi:MAG: bifunctional glutamate N-acetyltransferase/amino-acid acetyltransferase ArgJ [Actinobacteria bacterium]|nr:bifunctional glutamate N-acetyltransferase/amino-acid acetyltransferase ArgJ [Actinomycetota bacterium]